MDILQTLGLKDCGPYLAGRLQDACLKGFSYRKFLSFLKFRKSYMNRLILTVTAGLVLTFSSGLHAQHSDIEFGYTGGAIEVEFGSEGRMFESEFPTSGASGGFRNRLSVISSSPCTVVC